MPNKESDFAVSIICQSSSYDSNLLRQNMESHIVLPKRRFEECISARI
jgi:hypothetical protein